MIVKFEESKRVVTNGGEFLVRSFITIDGKTVDVISDLDAIQYLYPDIKNRPDYLMYSTRTFDINCDFYCQLIEDLSSYHRDYSLTIKDDLNINISIDDEFGDYDAQVYFKGDTKFMFYINELPNEKYAMLDSVFGFTNTGTFVDDNTVLIQPTSPMYVLNDDDFDSYLLSNKIKY